MSAPSGTVVWALVANSVLFRSTDQGSTWSQRSLPPGGRGSDLSFIDDHQGWLLIAGSSAVQGQSQQIEIWHTLDAGATWQRLGMTELQGQGKLGLSFSDPVNGFFDASDPNHHAVIYRTTDGGHTWTASQPLPDPPGFTNQPGGASLQAGRVHAFGGTLLVDAGRYVFRSIDGGATWTFLASAPISAVSIAFVTSSHWLQLISPGQSTETSDAGATWRVSPSGYSQAAPVTPDVVFGDSQVGYATVRGEIQRTIDGGGRWTGVRTPGT